jgi:hypothetical protein
MYSDSKFLEHTSTIFSTFSLYAASISHTSLYYCIIIFYILAYTLNYAPFFNVWLFDCLYFIFRFCSFFLGSDSCPSEFMQAFVWYRTTSMLWSRILRQLHDLICSRNGSVFRGFWVRYILDLRVLVAYYVKSPLMIPIAQPLIRPAICLSICRLSTALVKNSYSTIFLRLTLKNSCSI